MNNVERIAELIRAKAELDEAADIIEHAMHMSGMDRRFGDLPERIRELSSSNDADSVSNLIKELQYLDEEQPGWTRPLASVKNVNRKDI